MTTNKDYKVKNWIQKKYEASEGKRLDFQDNVMPIRIAKVFTHIVFTFLFAVLFILSTTVVIDVLLNIVSNAIETKHPLLASDPVLYAITVTSFATSINIVILVFVIPKLYKKLVYIVNQKWESFLRK
ncbi:hypothetical protein MTQ93_09625 [Staphylococcus agnetis]|uniref:hypothetical protein n=1 Tax=Staphylococcus agnetis TaxID=985762 RepID=UPI00208E2092|nr:hypothetical protein [Staphylococcus agnetis]MCO4346303.1 hypothetical protein [Staphylococcus agnetis]MCO4360621.1 hypothetical protein [Staphylococcus agnetis]